MIDFGSNCENWVDSAAYLRNTLWSTFARSQLFGGPASAWYTTGRFHWISLAGLECSCTHPIACPTSWRTDDRFWMRIVVAPGAASRLSVPTYEELPALPNMTRNSASAADASKRMSRFAYAVHSAASARNCASWASVPFWKWKSSTRPHSHNVFVGRGRNTVPSGGDVAVSSTVISTQLPSSSSVRCPGTAIVLPIPTSSLRPAKCAERREVDYAASTTTMSTNGGWNTGSPRVIETGETQGR